MNLYASHEMLVSGPDFETCRCKTQRFFDRHILIRYDTVHIAAAASVPATDPCFWERVTAGMAANRKVLAELIVELSAEGFKLMTDLSAMPKGYQSKIFHIIAHMLDGFFGVDSRFYVLDDDSHWLTDALRQSIKAAPTDYWLLKVDAESSVAVAAGHAPFIRAADVNPH